MAIEKKRRVMVIGHKNPDTDSICSAIAYADLKNRERDELAKAASSGKPVERGELKRYEACRAGMLNKESEYVLKRFGFQPPRLRLDVYAHVSDLDIRTEVGIGSNTSLRDAWTTMRDKEIQSLPVIKKDGTLDGIIAVQDIAMANMDSLDANTLSESRVPVKNILKTLNAELIVGDENAYLERGSLAIGAGSPEAMESSVKEGDIIIVANRYEMQLCAIELNASCLIVCLAPTIARTIKKLAEENGCMIISTPYDTYTTSRLICQSIPVGKYMRRNVQTFELDAPFEEVRDVMSRVRYNYFPVISADNKVAGMISKRNLIDFRKKEIVLVDHNEKSQCVDGIEDTEILGIIDHHRIGDMETTGPIYFRNQPVGCTATIIREMYDEAGMEISPQIAGILCCAILSDTLKFKSPTCTKKDERTARELAEIAGVDIDELSASMFSAGEDLTGKTPAEVFNNDMKIFRHGETRIAVAQGNFNSRNNLKKAKEIVLKYIDEALVDTGADMAYYIATDIGKQSSDIICAGKNAEEAVRNAFELGEDVKTLSVPGLVSRKKQFVPALLAALSE